MLLPKKGVLVALDNKELRVYNQKLLVSKVTIDNSIYSMKFGRFHDQQEVLAYTTTTGALYIKKLTANAVLTAYKAPIKEVEGQLELPVKTKLFVELADREKENAVS